MDKPPLELLKSAVKPRLRIFFSVDLVGSTNFKQKGGNDSKSSPSSSPPQWFSVILDFYSEFDKTLRQVIYDFEINGVGIAKSDRDSLSRLPELEFWKSVGDELLYTAELTHEKDASALVLCWIKTLNSYASIITKEHPSLNVKGTSWVAGFPERNIEVVIETKTNRSLDGYEDLDSGTQQYKLLNEWYDNPNDRSGKYKDYLGPSIDTGFRLTAFATPRRMPISIELARLILPSASSEPYLNEMKIYFDGKHNLKGVLGGKPYPLFWVKVPNDDVLIEYEAKMLKEEPVDLINATNYVREFITQNKDLITMPFICTANTSGFSTPPEGYLKRLQERQDTFEGGLTREEAKEKSFSFNELDAEGIKDHQENNTEEFLKLLEESFKNAKNKNN